MPSSDFFIQETAHLSIAQLAEATNATFADYFVPISHTPTGFAAFCRANSVDVAQSVLLEHAEGRLAGLSMLAVRGPRGWCGGFGIVPEFRGQGLAAVLVHALIGRACSLSLTTLQLEVLVQNAPAIKTYERAGFQTERELVILSGELGVGLTEIDAELDVQPIETPVEVWATGLGLPGPPPCWQRDLVSLLTVTDLHGRIARRAGTLAGVLLYRPNLPSGPLTVDSLAFSDEAAARALLARAVADTKIAQLFCRNEPEGSPLHVLLQSLGLRELHRQYEMRVDL